PCSIAAPPTCCRRPRSTIRRWSQSRPASGCWPCTALRARYRACNEQHDLLRRAKFARSSEPRRNFFNQERPELQSAIRARDREARIEDSSILYLRLAETSAKKFKKIRHLPLGSS